MFANLVEGGLSAVPGSGAELAGRFWPTLATILPRRREAVLDGFDAAQAAQWLASALGYAQAAEAVGCYPVRDNARKMPEESTTPDLAELSQRLEDAANARDLDAVMNLFADDAVYDMSAVGMGVFEGKEPIRGLYEDWLSSYEAFEVEVEEVRDLGHGVIFIAIAQRGRPHESANWIDVRYAVVASWADGLIELGMGYIDIDQARAAAERLAEERG